MPGLVHPLVPEPGEVFARRPQEGFPEVVGGRAAEGIIAEIAPDPGPEPLRPEIAEQHAQHERALGIDVVRGQGRERHASPRVDLQVLAVLVEVVIVRGMGSELRSPVLAGHELGEPFVEPEVRPVLGRDIVPEPLMRELVRDQDPLVPGAVQIGPVVREPVHERRGADVLHAPEEVRHGGLGVLRPRIAESREPRVDVDHVGGDAEQAAGPGAVRAVDVVVHGNAPPGVAEPDQRGDDQRHEIRGAGLVLAPRHGVKAAGTAPVRHEPAVRHDRVLRRDGRQELPGHLVVREVVGREPEVVVVVLPLTPDLLRPVRTAFRRDEREATAVLDAGVVFDREAQRVAEREGLRGIDDECVAVSREPQRRAPRVRHAGDLEQLAGVEDHRVERRPQRDERGRDATVERRRVPVEVPDLDPLVHEVVIVGTRIDVVRDALFVALRGSGSDGGGAGAEENCPDNRSHR